MNGKGTSSRTWVEFASKLIRPAKTKHSDVDNQLSTFFIHHTSGNILSHYLSSKPSTTLDYPPLRVSAIKTIGTDFHDSISLDSSSRSIIRHSHYPPSKSLEQIFIIQYLSIIRHLRFSAKLCLVRWWRIIQCCLNDRLISCDPVMAFICYRPSRQNHANVAETNTSAAKNRLQFGVLTVNELDLYSVLSDLDFNYR